VVLVGGDGGDEGGGGGGEVVVDDDGVVICGSGEFGGGVSKSSGDRVGSVGVAVGEAGVQVGEGGGCDENGVCVGVVCADGVHSGWGDAQDGG